jgi:hypothetical protein
MAFIRISVGLLLLATSAGLAYAGWRDDMFSLIDQSLAAVFLVSGIVLAWRGWRARRENRHYQRRHGYGRPRRTARVVHIGAAGLAVVMLVVAAAGVIGYGPDLQFTWPA